MLEMRSIAVIDNAAVQITVHNKLTEFKLPSKQIPIYLKIIGSVEFATEIAFHMLQLYRINTTKW